MLSKEYRLRKDKDFKLIYLKGKTFQTPFFIIKVLENNQNISKFGFVVNSKVSKKAVERNKLKRQMREIIRLNLKTLKKGFDIIIIAKKHILNKKFNFIEKNLLSLLKSAKVFKS